MNNLKFYFLCNFCSPEHFLSVLIAKLKTSVYYLVEINIPFSENSWKIWRRVSTVLRRKRKKETDPKRLTTMNATDTRTTGINLINTKEENTNETTDGQETTETTVKGIIASVPLLAAAGVITIRSSKTNREHPGILSHRFQFIIKI